jgi:hypothetical protein
MYIMWSAPMKTPHYVVRHPSPPFPVILRRMPVGNKRSRAAKKRRDEGNRQGRAIFAKCGATPPSPNTSDYLPSTSDDDQQESESDESSDDGERSEAGESVVAIQRLYSDFLPSHLRLQRLNPDDRDTKRRKISKRPAVYTGTLRTTLWRRSVALREAAQGCATLDAFVQRKVCSPKLKTAKRSMTLSTNRRDSEAPHHLKRIQ